MPLGLDIRELVGKVLYIDHMSVIILEVRNEKDYQKLVTNRGTIKINYSIPSIIYDQEFRDFLHYGVPDDR